jgi:single-stranded DNA-binding protein
MHVNVVHLIGYLGKNPEHKSVKASDRKYAVLSLATQRSWKGADEEWHSKTEWHRVVVIWNQGAASIAGHSELTFLLRGQVFSLPSTAENLLLPHRSED